MADDLLLTTPAGTVINLGSWLRAEPGPNFGADGLLQAVYTSHPKTEGGKLAHERVTERRMSFPLLLASGGAGVALTALEALLRHGARKGATLDIKPDGTATGDAIRFDVLTGRYEPDYHVRHHTAGIRLGTLELETEPFGYSPTWILLASAASVGLPGDLAIPAASILGDAPGLLRFAVQASNPANATLVGSWLPDVVGWGLSHAASFTSGLYGASWTGALPSAAYAARAESQNGTVLSIYLSPTHAGWTALAYYDITAGLEPAYRGRFRAFLYGRQHTNLGGQHNTLHLSLDAVAALNPSGPMASAARIASMPAQPQTNQYTPQFIDLGELTIPPEASGYARGVRLRLWGRKTADAGNANSFVDLDALHLLPLDGGAGYLAHGLSWPQIVETATQGRFTIDAHTGGVIVGMATGDLGTTLPAEDAAGRYRGELRPKVGPSTVALHLVGAGRRRDRGEAYAQAILADSPRAYWRLDDLAASPTVADSSGNANHGTYVGQPSRAQPGLTGEPSSYAVYWKASAWGGVGSGVISIPSGFGIEAWTLRQSAGRDSICGHGPNDPNRRLTIGYTNDEKWQFEVNGHVVVSDASYPHNNEIHHWVTNYFATSRLVNFFLDSELVGSQIIGCYIYVADAFYIGRSAPGAPNGAFAGALDEIAVYNLPLASARIRAHYLAGAVDDEFVAKPGQTHAAVSVYYRPRFQFLKGGI